PPSLMTPRPPSPTPFPYTTLFRAPSSLADGCSASIAVGDFDEDSALDVGILDLNATKLTVAFGAGNGTFGNAVTVAVGAEPAISPPFAGSGGPCARNNTLAQPGY